MLQTSGHFTPQEKYICKYQWELTRGHGFAAWNLVMILVSYGVLFSDLLGWPATRNLKKMSRWYATPCNFNIELQKMCFFSKHSKCIECCIAVTSFLLRNFWTFSQRWLYGFWDNVLFCNDQVISVLVSHQYLKPESLFTSTLEFSWQLSYRE